MMGVSRDWVYAEIHEGRIPLVTFCGRPVKPWLVDLDRALPLFSSTQDNIIAISSARSLKTKELNELVSHKPVKKEDLWD